MSLRHYILSKIAQKLDNLSIFYIFKKCKKKVINKGKQLRKIKPILRKIWS